MNRGFALGALQMSSARINLALLPFPFCNVLFGSSNRCVTPKLLLKPGKSLNIVLSHWLLVIFLLFSLLMFSSSAQGLHQEKPFLP
ncbi:hypothetical protein BDP27DRAFT_1352487, partial [Rhodocollybia butyracea]